MVQQADLEAGVALLSIPESALIRGARGQVTQPAHSLNHIPSGSTSSAREQVSLANQPRLRKKPKPKPPLIRPRTSRQADIFFETLQAVLDHGTRDHCLFFCWELGVNDQRAAPLLIEDIENEVRIYQDLVGKWYEKQGWWRRYVPFYGVVAVEEVDLRFLKKNDHDFSVLVGTLTIPQLKARLTSELENADAMVYRSIDPDDPGGDCEQDMKTGRWDHCNTACLNERLNYAYACCAFQSQHEYERKLNQLGLLGLPLLCFQNPEIAAGQRTLQGLAQESCIYRTSEIRGSSYFESRIAEAKFRGLMIRWGFKGMRRPFDVPVLALMIVTLWKACGGNWEAAFAAGGFFIVLVSYLSAFCK